MLFSGIPHSGMFAPSLIAKLAKYLYTWVFGSPALLLEIITFLPGGCKEMPEVVEDSGLAGFTVGAGWMLVLAGRLTVGRRGFVDCSQLYNFFTSWTSPLLKSVARPIT